MPSLRPSFRLLALACLAAPASHAAPADEGARFFENEVRPLLVKHCYECHSQESGKQKGGLLLDRREGWQIGGDAGPSIIPGDVEKSLFIHSIRYLDEDLQMPPKSRLADAEVAVLEKWVRMGAPDPRDAALADAVRKEEINFQEARQSWAFRPLQDAPAPLVANKDWPRRDMDRFILARLEEQKLAPAPDADARVLLRRLSYDLTGLPPSLAEVEAFARDHAAEPEAALARQVDRLLHSTAYGEKFGRHWLDLVRYADSNGGDRNYTFYQAWRYRNYVIRAFNDDKPYHEFIREQVAGDLMPTDSEEQRRERLVASTFLALGPKMLTERDKEKLNLDTVDEQMDTLGRAFLGLTIGCARCHDHKFDPFSQRDYYAMAGFFRSTQVVMGTRNGCVNVASWVEQPLPGPQMPELTAKVERLELTMRLKVERDFMKKAGGKMAKMSLALAGVVYDDEDAELVGEWKASTLSPNHFGERYLHNDRKEKGAKKVIFRGSLPESGVYEVRLAHPGKPNGASNVPVTIEAFDGVHEVVMNQARSPRIGGLFDVVGRFHFEKGGRVNVIIGTQDTDGYVFADAVQFIHESDIEREAAALAMAEGKADGDPLLMMDSAGLAKQLNQQIAELKDAELAMAPRDAADAGDVHLRVRGEPGQLGPLVPRGFPAVLHEGPPPAIAAGSSGRLEFAGWLAGGGNPLLDRVIVNRVWAWLHGRGIVATVDNFGGQSSGPTHPELLDHLAAKFRASGGSIKALVREIVLSRSYRLAAESAGPRVRADPENLTFARRSMRRLSAEEIRDSLLLLTGELDSQPAAATALTFGEDLDKPMNLDKERRRSVYLPVARNNQLPEMEIFDAANPEMVAGERPLTTVPTQALYLLNSRLMQGQATALGQAAYTQPESVQWLYQNLLGRGANVGESERAEAFFRSSPDREEAVADLAHALLASTEFLFLE